MIRIDRIIEILFREGVLSNRLVKAIKTIIHVQEAIDAGELQESQREWAEAFCNRHPEGFFGYIGKIPSSPRCEHYTTKWENEIERLGVENDQLARFVEKLRAENRCQRGKIRALNDMIRDLQERLDQA